MFIPVWVIVIAVLFILYLIWSVNYQSNRAALVAYEFERYAIRVSGAFYQIADETNPADYEEIHPALFAAVVRVNTVAKKEIN
ncbi:TPA: hypothetical protein ACJ3CO_003702 [Salmonella enterica subsp. enterica serovar Virchow]|nr:hypothetical protein [Salmonella enterica subsp. enterica serovar Javiana]ECH9478890.1 hypothetical protein [Salmonella enterica subsp. enterica]